VSSLISFSYFYLIFRLIKSSNRFEKVSVVCRLLSIKSLWLTETFWFRQNMLIVFPFLSMYLSLSPLLFFIHLFLPFSIFLPLPSILLTALHFLFFSLFLILSFSMLLSPQKSIEKSSCFKCTFRMNHHGSQKSLGKAKNLKKTSMDSLYQCLEMLLCFLGPCNNTFYVHDLWFFIISLRVCPCQA